jgi:hypothetical protein
MRSPGETPGRFVACAGLAALLAVPGTTWAEEASSEAGRAVYPEHGLLFYPSGPGPARDRWSVGGIWQIAPMFAGSYRRGLGAGFSVDARLQTIVLYNQLGVGGAWAAQWGPFALGLTLHVDGFVGTLGKAFVATTQFDSVGWGVLIDPGAFAGIQVTVDSWLTLKYEAYLSPYQAAKLGDLVVSPDAPLDEGSGLSLLVEYVPARAGVIYYGVSLYHTRTNYPLWFNVEASGSSSTYSPQMIWYLGLLAGYEF